MQDRAEILSRQERPAPRCETGRDRMQDRAGILSRQERPAPRCETGRDRMQRCVGILSRRGRPAPRCETERDRMQRCAGILSRQEKPARKAGSTPGNKPRQDPGNVGNPVAAEILDEMATAGKVQPTRSCSRNTPARAPYLNRAKKSLPLSSTRMKAGKSSTRIFQMASMPSSGYSTHSMLLMLFWARMAAGPPIEPR